MRNLQETKKKEDLKREGLCKMRLSRPSAEGDYPSERREGRTLRFKVFEEDDFDCFRGETLSWNGHERVPAGKPNEGASNRRKGLQGRTEVRRVVYPSVRRV